MLLRQRVCISTWKNVHCGANAKENKEIIEFTYVKLKKNLREQRISDEVLHTFVVNI